MGRLSKLTSDQWEEIGARLLQGESVSQVARDFTKSTGTRITESTIRSHFSGRDMRRVREEPKAATPNVVSDVVMTHLVEREAPISVADELGENLRSIALTYTRAANVSGNTALRCIVLANTEMQKVDDATPGGNEKRLKTVAILTRMALDALDPARSLLMASANKELLQRALDETGKTNENETVSPERMADAVRRFAFMLARVGATETN